MIAEEQIKELGDTLAGLPARPHSYSYEGTIRPDGKHKGYADYHVHSICGGPDTETETEKHHCLGNVIAKDEGTAARLARLIEVAPLLFDEVVRLRTVLMGLTDDAKMWENIGEAEDCGNDGVRCAYKSVQAIAREALGCSDAP